MTNDASFLTLFLQPVAGYLADEAVSEILINGPDQIYIERKGRLELTPAKFVNEASLKVAPDGGFVGRHEVREATTFLADAQVMGLALPWK